MPGAGRGASARASDARPPCGPARPRANQTILKSVTGEKSPGRGTRLPARGTLTAAFVGHGGGGERRGKGTAVLISAGKSKGARLPAARARAAWPPVQGKGTAGSSSAGGLSVISSCGLTAGSASAALPVAPLPSRGVRRRSLSERRAPAPAPAAAGRPRCPAWLRWIRRMRSWARSPAPSCWPTGAAGRRRRSGARRPGRPRSCWGRPPPPPACRQSRGTPPPPCTCAGGGRGVEPHYKNAGWGGQAGSHRCFACVPAACHSTASHLAARMPMLHHSQGERPGCPGPLPVRCRACRPTDCAPVWRPPVGVHHVEGVPARVAGGKGAHLGARDGQPRLRQPTRAGPGQISVLLALGKGLLAKGRTHFPARCWGELIARAKALLRRQRKQGRNSKRFATACSCPSAAPSAPSPAPLAKPA